MWMGVDYNLITTTSCGTVNKLVINFSLNRIKREGLGKNTFGN